MTSAPITINHQGQFPVVTLSFNLAPNASLGDAVDGGEQGEGRDSGCRPAFRRAFQGTAEAFQASLANEPILILAALITVYLVLGVLYESYIHPITILSTLPSAGVGALLALIIFRQDFSVIALIGIVLLIGIVKKNAIMMIDFALEAERKEGMKPEEAIYQACLLRFRPIMMTTMAALLGGVPLALGTGSGSELRRPLGITIIGGLLFSQLLTLYTTPVIYIWFDRLAQRFSRQHEKRRRRCRRTDAVPRRVSAMNISEPFIRKPVATTLLTVAIALAGAAAYRLLPVSPLPQVDFPTISVSAGLPGASPETMASSVATPLERQFGHIAAVTEMTSSSSLGSTSITLQFDLDRDIDAAARDVQAAINAARGYLPTNLPEQSHVPQSESGGFADLHAGADLARRSRKAQMYDAASTIMAQKLSQISGVGQVTVGGSSLPSVRIELNPHGAEQIRHRPRDRCARVLSSANANTPKGHFSDGNPHVGSGRERSALQGQRLCAAGGRLPQRSRRCGSPISGEAQDSVEDIRNSGYANGKPSVLVIIFRQPGANIIDTVDRIRAVLPQLHAVHPACDRRAGRHGPNRDDPRFRARCRGDACSSRWCW